jgi:hypothetical protein
MAPIIYKVTSTYPPALTYHPLGGRQIIAGTITKVEVGSTIIPNNSRLPDHTSVQQLVWVKPEPSPAIKATTKTVAGTKGKTYVVTTLPTGRQTCTCPGFTFRRTCKHLGA